MSARSLLSHPVELALEWRTVLRAQMLVFAARGISLVAMTTGPL